MRRDVRSGVLVATLLCGSAWSHAARGTDDVPDLGFLEYLGALVEQDGNWVGPDDMGVAENVVVIAGDASQANDAPPPIEQQPPAEQEMEEVP